MPSNFEDAISTVLKHEGGFSNDAVDPGGATNFGISLRYLRTLPNDVADVNCDGVVDANDIIKMTREQAIDIYRRGWWDPGKFSSINHQMIATKLFDLAVNMGSRQMGRIAQRALIACGITIAVDGIVGPKTIEKINITDPQMLLTKIRSEAAEFYLTLIAKKPALVKFQKGWLNRAYS